MKRRTLVSRTFSPRPSPRSLTPVQLILPTESHMLRVLIDSGADENFMDWNMAKRLHLTVSPLLKPLEARALDGRLLCRVTHRTQPIRLVMAQGHSEQLSFHLYCSPQHPVILGLPWLKQHNPKIDWISDEVTGWGEGCKLCCPPPKVAKGHSFAHETLPPPDLSSVPSCYHDLGEVFSKA